MRRLKWGIYESKNRERFKRYLRVLDGDAAGAKPRQIGEKLFSDLLKGIPPKPAKPAKRNKELMAREKRDAERRAKAQRRASNRARDALEAARGLISEPWVILLSNPPRHPSRSRKVGFKDGAQWSKVEIELGGELIWSQAGKGVVRRQVGDPQCGTGDERATVANARPPA